MALFNDLVALSEPNSDPLHGLAQLFRRHYFADPFTIAFIGRDGISAARWRVFGSIECGAESRGPSGGHADGDVHISMFWEQGAIDRLPGETQPQIVRGRPQEYGLRLDGVSNDYLSMAILPVFLDGRADQKILLFGTTPDQFQKLDLDQALLYANLAGSYLARKREVDGLQEANRWIQKELDQLARLQRLLLPRRETEIKGMRFAASYRVCEQVGGDYYDVARLRRAFGNDQPPDAPDNWGVMIADSAGHGAAAAVEVAMYDAILRTYRAPFPEAGAAEVFNYANQYLFTRVIRGTFLTAFGMGFRPPAERLIYASAGHPPPLLKRTGAEQAEQLVGSAGIPLGVAKEYRWENTTCLFYPGDIVVLYTDGVIEARSPAGEEFGMERFTRLVDEHRGDPETLIATIERAVDAHQQGIARKDDQTVIVVQRV